jgi:hypothetical protein
VGTPASAHSVPAEPNDIYCMAFCFTEAICLHGLIVALNLMDSKGDYQFCFLPNPSQLYLAGGQVVGDKKSNMARKA